MRRVSTLLFFDCIQLSAIPELGWTAAGTSEAPPGLTALISGPPYITISQPWPPFDGAFRRCGRAGSTCVRSLCRRRDWIILISTGRDMSGQQGSWSGRSWLDLASWMTRSCSASSIPTATQTAAPMCWWMQS